MKYILSIITTLAVLFGTVGVSFAEITENTPNSGTVSVDYNMDVAYTVTIPPSVTFTDSQKTVESGVAVSNIRLGEEDALNVSVRSLNGFQMRNGDGYIDYELVVNTYEVSGTDDVVILTVYSDESFGWAYLFFSTELDKSNATRAGRYTDTLTFTVSIT